jgi:hypothetical protein
MAGLGLLGAIGCGGGSADGCAPVTNGLGGNGDFDYECVGAADPECDGERAFVLGGRLPRLAIAQGARFRLRYLGAPGAVVPVSPSAVLSANGEFSARRAGWLGFIVPAGPDIEDAIRLQFLEPDSLEVQKRDAGVEVTGTTNVRAVARNRGALLAGNMPVTWSVDPPGLAAVDPTADGTCRVRGLVRGTVRVIARTDALTGELTLDVEPSGPEDAGADASDGDASDADARDAGEDR